MPFRKGVSGSPEHQFQPGKSGNPLGKSQWSKPIRELLWDHVPSAIARLLELMGSKDERVAMDAVKEVLSRVFGRIPDTIPDAHPRELLQIVAPNESETVEAWLRDIGRTEPHDA